MPVERQDLTAGEPESWRARGGVERYGGHDVFVMDEGDGPDVLLCLHGFPTASWDWHRVWPDLVSRFRVVAPDFLGFGFSAKPARYPYSIVDQAHLVEGVLARRGVGRFHVLAHDIGDTVAQELLARQLERGTDEVESLTLLNGGLFPETHRPVAIQRLLLSRLGPLVSRLAGERAFRRSFSKIFAPSTQPTDTDLARWWRVVSDQQGMRNAHLLIRYMEERVRHRERWVGALCATAVPVRLVDGLEDRVSGAHMVQRYRELVPSPDVVELAHVGHYPHLEDPTATVKALLAGAAGR